jgi:CheY-like chemotaxis protein/anti-sigma regulatory factor (Ser/Thr protein kinase)
MPTALIVEDEPEANRLLSLLVQLRGYQTASAYTGSEALELARQHHPDLMFLDLMLPDMNGYEVCDRLKRQRETNPIPIIIVTARVAPESRVDSVRAGANDYIAKPYTPDQIFQALAMADCWRLARDQHPTEGQIAIHSLREVEPYEQIAQLRSLLLARSALDEEAIGQLSRALMELTQNVLEWGRKQRDSALAEIRYRIDADRLTLTVFDRAGWSSSSDLPHERALGLLVGGGRFDAIHYDESGTQVELMRWLPRPSSSSRA